MVEVTAYPPVFLSEPQQQFWKHLLVRELCGLKPVGYTDSYQLSGEREGTSEWLPVAALCPEKMCCPERAMSEPTGCGNVFKHYRM